MEQCCSMRLFQHSKKENNVSHNHPCARARNTEEIRKSSLDKTNCKILNQAE